MSDRAFGYQIQGDATLVIDAPDGQTADAMAATIQEEHELPDGYRLSGFEPDPYGDGFQREAASVDGRYTLQGRVHLILTVPAPNEPAAEALVEAAHNRTFTFAGPPDGRLTFLELDTDGHDLHAVDGVAIAGDTPAPACPAGDGYVINGRCTGAACPAAAAADGDA